MNQRPQPRLKFAVYDCPQIVSKRITEVLTGEGHDVLFEGALNKDNACTEADVWIAKWTFLFTPEFLPHFHPRKGIITLTSGKDHINEGCIRDLGLKVFNCPEFSSNSVAEHAMALAMRSLYGPCVLPPLSDGKVLFTRFSDEHAEAAVAQMLMRSRQMNESIKRANSYEYFRPDDPMRRRHDEPWFNDEMSELKIGIVGDDRTPARLFQMLSEGFRCKIFGFEASNKLDVEHLHLLHMLDYCDYVFLCTERFGLQKINEPNGQAGGPPMRFDSNELPMADFRLSGSSVSVLGLGRIGLKIARISRHGFGCDVSYYKTKPDPSLEEREGISFKGVESALNDSNFVFVALPLNAGTKFLVKGDHLSRLSTGRQRVIVNVTRDKIIESDPLYSFLANGCIFSYATDVLPNDYVLWTGGQPDDTTKKFVQHSSVVATPHEGDCSWPSLERMARDVIDIVKGGEW
ncbi:MAG TPA: NAD(P)-dependent oxidoreductase [Candidatus Bilamarchaeum sp.]|nr:NAD(P)-dependent oxidoreductase [Candidatus Bilamarchaeum sp.]